LVGVALSILKNENELSILENENGSNSNWPLFLHAVTGCRD
jgi:hypothetical protein